MLAVKDKIVDQWLLTVAEVVMLDVNCERKSFIIYVFFVVVL